MYEETKRSKVVKYILIGIALLFVFVMLVLPLVTVICEASKRCRGVPAGCQR